MHWKEIAGTFLASSTTWWVFSTFIRNMPKPEPGERWYACLYNSLQAIAANHDLRQ